MSSWAFVHAEAAYQLTVLCHIRQKQTAYAINGRPTLSLMHTRRFFQILPCPFACSSHPRFCQNQSNFCDLCVCVFLTVRTHTHIHAHAAFGWHHSMAVAEEHHQTTYQHLCMRPCAHAEAIIDISRMSVFFCVCMVK